MKREKERKLLHQYFCRDVIISFMWLAVFIVFAFLAFVDLRSFFETHIGLVWRKRDQYMFTVVFFIYLIWGLPFHTWRRCVGIALDLLTGLSKRTCQLPHEWGGGYRNESLFGTKIECNSIIPYSDVGPAEEISKWRMRLIYLQAPWTEWHVDNRICCAEDLYTTIQKAANKGGAITITYLRYSRMVVDILQLAGKHWSIDNIADKGT
jgi:hypothetical protein